MKRHIIIAILALLCVFGIAWAQTAIDPDTTPVVDSSTITPESTTWAVLNAAAAGGTLTPGKWYSFVYNTTHVIPQSANLPGGAVTNYGPAETLIVRAATSTTLYAEAHSLIYPQDIIHYDLSGLGVPGATRGWITYREDTLNNIVAYEDWRAIKLYRWETGGDGLYRNHTYQEGMNYVEIYMIANTPTPGVATGSESIRLGAPPRHSSTSVTNVSIGTGSRKIQLDDYVQNVHIGDNSSAIIIAHSNSNIIIGNGCGWTKIGCCSDNVIIGNSSKNITIGEGVANLTVGTNSTQIVVADYSDDWTIASNVSLIYIEPSYLGSLEYAAIANSGYLGYGRSTIPTSYDVNGGSTLDMTTIPWAGIVNVVDGGGGGFAIQTILNAPTGHPVRLVSAYDSIQIYNTTGPLVFPQSVYDAGGVTLNGSYGDWIEFENRNGTLYYIGHQNYMAP